MKKISLFLTILFFSITAWSQTTTTNSPRDAVFCGKTRQDIAKAAYTIEELQKLDFKISPVDTNLTIIEFQLVMLGKDKSVVGKKIKGSEISKEDKTQILANCRSFYIEEIRTRNKQGQTVVINPIVVKIKR